MTRAVARDPEVGRLVILNGTIPPEIEKPISDSASVLGWAIQTAYGGAEAEGALAIAQAEAFNTVMSLAVDLPLLSSLPSETTQWALAQVTNDAIDRITQVDATTDNIEAHKEIELLTADAYAAANAEVGAGTYDPPPAAAYIPGSDPRRFDFDSEAYQRWLRDDGPTTFLQDKVMNPYATAWPNL